MLVRSSTGVQVSMSDMAEADQIFFREVNSHHLLLIGHPGLPTISLASYGVTVMR